MTTYKTFGDAVADPTSNIARFARDATAEQARNAAIIDARIAEGLTREQAWAEQIAAMRRDRAR